MGIVEEEADETIYWLELLVEAELVRETEVAGLINAANQIVAMAVTSIRTARAKKD
jgi:four helix bundle protein